ncbi:MAG: DUF4442 domain-containing protein [Ekhidna sp.]|nr:DUF4442 domain-containing protein [Ekhidna sp.]
MYQLLSKIAKKYFSGSAHKLFRFFFNYSPMYRRSTRKVVRVSPGFWEVDVKIPISYRNRNYAGTIFGGSLFSATDPIYMVQLIQIIGAEYIVWDKSSVVKFKRPANSDVFVEFRFNAEEVEELKKAVAREKELDITKIFEIKNKEYKVVCEIEKLIYVAEKTYYKEKRKRKNNK